MPDLKLGLIPDEKLVKLTIELPASVHRDLVAYADVLAPRNRPDRRTRPACCTDAHAVHGDRPGFCNKEARSTREGIPSWRHARVKLRNRLRTGLSLFANHTTLNGSTSFSNGRNTMSRYTTSGSAEPTRLIPRPSPTKASKPSRDTDRGSIVGSCPGSARCLMTKSVSKDPKLLLRR